MIRPKKSDLSLISKGSESKSGPVRGEPQSSSHERKRKISDNLLDGEVKDSKEVKPKKKARISDSSFPQSGGGVKKSMDLTMRKRKQSIL